MIKIDVKSTKQGDGYLVNGTNKISGKHREIVAEIAAILIELDKIDDGSALREAIEIHMEAIFDDMCKS